MPKALRNHSLVYTFIIPLLIKQSLACSWGAVNRGCGYVRVILIFSMLTGVVLHD